MNRNKTRILIIDDNVEPLTIAVIRCLGISKNAEIHVLNLGGLRLPSYRFSKYLKSYRSVRATDDNNVWLSIRRICEVLKVDIIIPIKEKTVRIITERIEKFREFVSVLPVPDPRTLDTVRNKWLLYNWLYETKRIQVKPVIYADVIRSKDLVDELVYPILIKPFYGSGGRAIKLIRNRIEFMNYVPEKGYDAKEMLIQNYLEGRDIDLSALTANGEILVYNIQQDISVNNKLKYSRSIEFVQQDELRAYAAEIIKDLKYTGIAHMDFRYNEGNNSYILVDFNARFWSSLLGSLSSGINFPWLSCEYALNQPLVIPQFKLGNYYLTHNLFKILYKRISIAQTELYYTFRDPAPFLIQAGESAIYHLKKLFNKVRNYG